jgi:hypothetical protein
MKGSVHGRHHNMPLTGKVAHLRVATFSRKDLRDPENFRENLRFFRWTPTVGRKFGHRDADLG